jgi:glycosyltransferase involved in cell wall biosynthesis
VIYPPVDTETFAFCSEKNDYFITVSRLVPYKQVETIIDAFRSLPDQNLIVVGDGPLFSHLQNNLPSNVKMVGSLDRNSLINLLQHSRALIYAAKEDFGIVLVEAQSCGTPVIAFNEGGALESVNGLDTPNPTGLFFTEQSPQAITEAVNSFLLYEDRILAENCRKNAENYSINKFRENISQLVTSNLGQYHL